MDKKILIIIPIFVLAFASYGIYFLSSSSTPDYFFNLGIETNKSNILSGYYTGNIIIDGIALVPEENNVTISNAKFIGDAIYVYGEIEITNTYLHSNIFVMDFGSISLKGAILKKDVQIYCFNNASAYIENISRGLNYTELYPLAELITFDNSYVLINNSVITSDSYDQSSLTLLNMKNETITSQKSRINIFQDAEANLINSSIDLVYLTEYTSIVEKPVLKLNSSSIISLSAYSNSTTWIQNSSRVIYLSGYQNAIFYIDGSSLIGFPSLFDNAQIIPI